MCARNHNKKSFSHAFLFLRLLALMSLGFVFMAQGRAMDPDLLSETDPLHGSINNALGKERQLDVTIGIDLTLTKIDVPQELTTPLDSSKAVEAMKNVNRYLRYADIIASEATEEEKKFFQEIKDLGICDNKEDLSDTLLDNALSATGENGSIQAYFRKNKEQVNSSIEKILELEEQNTKLISTLLSERIEQDNLYRTNKILLACLIAGGMTTIGGGLWVLMCYLGRAC